MRIAVLSDSHDQIPHLHLAVQRANQMQADLLIHCGDLISPFMLRYLHAFNGPVHLIYGNNAGDQHLISSRCGKIFVNIHHHGIHGSITAGGWRIAFIHYPELARELARSGEYHLVCYGHDHIFHSERQGACLLVNPGDLLGKEDVPSFALVDLEQGVTHREFVGNKLVIPD
ncbi:MAG: YfcE family phosphodiesterase [Desulfobulbus sp.]|nr:YfcE family phosphodiesterase [Desulfobulbus sp.]